MAHRKHLVDKKHKSGDGERRAMVGYSAQYRVASEIIYDTLLKGKLEWIRIADPEAGQVDDIQIACPGRLDAYQVKWGEYVKNISFNNITKDERKKGKITPSIIRQLAEGWKRLSFKYPERKITVHLVHRSVPSAINSNIPVDDPPPFNPNFQGFINTCW